MSERPWLYASSLDITKVWMEARYAERYRKEWGHRGILILDTPRLFISERKGLIQIFIHENLVAK